MHSKTIDQVKPLRGTPKGHRLEIPTPLALELDAWAIDLGLPHGDALATLGLFALVKLLDEDGGLELPLLLSQVESDRN